MTGLVARRRSGAMSGLEMPLIVWLIAGAGVWFAALSAMCALLAVLKRGPRCGGLPENDAAGLVEPRISVDVDHSTSGERYALHVRGDVVAWLHWRTGPGRPAGWYLSQRRGGWQRLAVGADVDLDAPPPGGRQGVDPPPSLSTALALDAAANVPRGPPAGP